MRAVAYHQIISTFISFSASREVLASEFCSVSLWGSRWRKWHTSRTCSNSNEGSGEKILYNSTQYKRLSSSSQSSYPSPYRCVYTGFSKRLGDGGWRSPPTKAYKTFAILETSHVVGVFPSWDIQLQRFWTLHLCFNFSGYPHGSRTDRNSSSTRRRRFHCCNKRLSYPRTSCSSTRLYTTSTGMCVLVLPKGVITS